MDAQIKQAICESILENFEDVVISETTSYVDGLKKPSLRITLEKSVNSIVLFKAKTDFAKKRLDGYLEFIIKRSGPGLSIFFYHECA